MVGQPLGELTGGPAPARLPRAARGEAGQRTADRLWAVSEELTGVTYALSRAAQR